MNRPEKKIERELMEAYIQDLLFRAKHKNEIDLLAEILLGMSSSVNYEGARARQYPPAEPKSTRFEIVRMSANGHVSVGAIQDLEQAKKVLLCLNSTESESYFLYDASAGKVVEVFGSLAYPSDQPTYSN
jgi:hypothetical protein